MTIDKLSQAVQLIKAGNKVAALPILKEVVQAEPNNENAWLWLYSCVEKVEQKKYCLQQALKINSNNQDAYTALLKLENRMPAKPQSTNRETESSLHPTLDHDANDEKHPTNKSPISVKTLLVGLLTIGVFCLTATLFFLFAPKNTSVFGDLPFLSSAKFDSATGNPAFIDSTYNLTVNSNIQLTINYPVEIKQGVTVKLVVTCANNSDKPIENFTVGFNGEPNLWQLNINYFDGISVISTDSQVVEVGRDSSGNLYFDVGTVNPRESKDVFLNLTANLIGVYFGNVHLFLDQDGLNGHYDLDFTTTVK